MKIEQNIKKLIFIFGFLQLTNFMFGQCPVVEDPECSFTINNTGASGGDTEYFLEIDGAGLISNVTAGPGPITITDVALGGTAEVLHLVYDSADPPTNVPPVIGDDPEQIIGCTNDFLGLPIFLSCICQDQTLEAAYAPAGGDELKYFLTDASGVVLDCNATGFFGEDEAVGEYFIFALTYDSTNPPTVIPVIGDNISTFSFDGCYNQDFLASACCVQKTGCCPLVTEINGDATICDSELMDELADWMNLVESDPVNMQALANMNTDGSIVYSLIEPSNVSGDTPLPPGEIDGVWNGMDFCAPVTQTNYAYLLCLGPDGSLGNNLDNIYMCLGQFDLTVNPPAQVPAEDVNECVVTLTPECMTDAIAIADTPNVTGDADAANLIGSVYTAMPGDASGTIDIEVTNEFGCTIIFTLPTPMCDDLMDPCAELTPVLDNSAGGCPSDVVIGTAGNETAPYFTEYLVLDGPGGNILGVFPNLGDAQTAADVELIANGASCIKAINHNGISDVVDALDAGAGGLLCGLIPCPVNDLSTLAGFLGGLPGGFNMMTIMDLLGPSGVGNPSFDVGVGLGLPLPFPVVVDVPAVCYAFSTEICFDMTTCSGGCMELAPVLDNSAGGCPSDVVIGSAGNEVAPYFTEYLVLDTPGGNIIGIFSNIADALTAADTELTLNGTSCVKAINHDGISEVVDALDAGAGGLLCGLIPCPVNDLSTLAGFLGGLPGGFTMMTIMDLLGPSGAGNPSFDVGAGLGLPLPIPVVVDVPAVCYAFSSEACFDTVSCNLSVPCDATHGNLEIKAVPPVGN